MSRGWKKKLRREKEQLRNKKEIKSLPLESESTVETVVLLGGEKVDGYVEIDLDVDKLENKGGRATYAEIKSYIEEKYGFKVPSLYIAQIKDKVGLDKRLNHNHGSGEGPTHICPAEKEEAIMDAFRHFSLI